MSLVANWRLQETGGVIACDDAGTNNGTWDSAELITNGDMSVAGDWTDTALNSPPSAGGWSIGAGVATRATGETVSSGILQANKVNLGKEYLFSALITTTGSPDGVLRFNAGGFQFSSGTKAAGPVTFTESILVTNPNQNGWALYQGTTDWEGTVDDASCKQNIFRDNGGILFNGTSDFIQVPDNAALDFGTGAFTLAMWLNPAAAIPPAVKKVLQKFNVAGYAIFHNNADGKWGFATFSGSADEIKSNTSAVANTWQHVAATRDASGNMLIYIDGIVQTDTGSDVADLDNVGDLFISSTGAASFFDGSISDVRIYDEALSASEIYNIANPLTPFKFITEIRN